MLVGLGRPEIAEFAAHQGLDWIWLDWQHGLWSEDGLMNALPAFTAVDTVPIVRVRGHSAWEIGRVLDMGAMGVIVPMVSDAEEAKNIVAWAKYPPLGCRSGGGMRLSILADGFDATEYFAHANDEILVSVMVETAAAVDRVDEILAVEGVDVVLIGPGDLLLDVKSRGGDVAERDRYVDKVLSAGERANKAVGYFCSDLDIARRCFERGFRFVCVGADTSALRAAIQSQAETAKSWPAPGP
jgi:4-hydroxy-2-oxoheptanedioate aldolase